MKHKLSITTIINIAKNDPLIRTLVAYQLKAFSKQTYKNIEVVYILSHTLKETIKRDIISILKNYSRELSINTRIVEVSNDRGLSFGRNIGLILSNSEIVAFIDDDAIPSPSWSQRLAEIFTNHTIDAVFGGALPVFIDKRRCINIPEEFYWVFSCTSKYRSSQSSNNLQGFGVNMAFRRDTLLDLGGFNIRFGVSSKKKHWIGGDETEVIIRFLHHNRKILWDPRLIVYHVITPSRCALKYLLKRAYSVGRSNSTLFRLYNNEPALKRFLNMRKGILYDLIRSILNNLLQLRTEKALTSSIVILALMLGFVRGPYKEVFLRQGD